MSVRATAALAAAALLLALAGPAHAADITGSDDRAEGNTRLDLVGARLEQTARGELALVLRTSMAFAPAELVPSPAHMLCVFLRDSAASAPGGRLCVIAQPRAKSGVGLRYTTLDPTGRRIGIRELPTVVRREPRSVSASFSPGLLRLAAGSYAWHARSLAGGVEDLLPDAGEIPLRIERAPDPPARPRCFGAASRDPRRLCRNPLLRLSVSPTPDEALVAQNSPCSPVELDGVLTPCEFGVPAAEARATVALIGDSHAAHWRAALEVVAQAKRWRGLSITRSGCPFTRAALKLEEPARLPACLRFNEQVPRWLARHPEIRTVFVASHVAGRVGLAGHDSALAAKSAGFRGAWRALPDSVRRIVVIRDTPLVGAQVLDCVRRALAARRDAGRACAVSRARVLRPDAAYVAARRLRSARVRRVDMTPFLCGGRRCETVVGGALVYKDGQHLTDVFATSLGPYLRRAIDDA